VSTKSVKDKRIREGKKVWGKGKGKIGQKKAVNQG